MISLIAQERLLGFGLGVALAGVVVLEQRRAIYRSVSAQNHSPPRREELVLRKDPHIDFAHMWNKAVDGTLGPLIAALSSRGC